MDSIPFTQKYDSFSLMLDDIERVKSHYKKFNLVVAFDIYPSTTTVKYEVSKERQKF